MADSIQSSGVTAVCAFVAGMVAAWWMLDPKGGAKAHFDAGYESGVELTLDDVGACIWFEQRIRRNSFSGCMVQRAVSGKEWLHRYPDAADSSK
jgi:hypothetical protein